MAFQYPNDLSEMKRLPLRQLMQNEELFQTDAMMAMMLFFVSCRIPDVKMDLHIGVWQFHSRFGFIVHFFLLCNDLIQLLTDLELSSESSFSC